MSTVSTKKLSSLSKRAAPRGTGGAALAVWFPGRSLWRARPGRTGGDDRAPGHGERYVVDGCRRAPEARGRPSAPREPEHRGEVRRNGGRVARRADAPEEGQARARGQRGVGRGRPRGRPRGPEEASPHRQADLRQADRRARLRRAVLHRAKVRPRAQARPGGGGRRGHLELE